MGEQEYLDIGGERYVASRSAAEKFGYTSDYIGQLARGGSVRAQLIGRTWYVHEGDMRERKKSKKGRGKALHTTKRPSRPHTPTYQQVTRNTPDSGKQSTPHNDVDRSAPPEPSSEPTANQKRFFDRVREKRDLNLLSQERRRRQDALLGELDIRYQPQPRNTSTIETEPERVKPGDGSGQSTTRQQVTSRTRPVTLRRTMRSQARRQMHHAPLGDVVIQQTVQTARTVHPSAQDDGGIVRGNSIPARHAKSTRTRPAQPKQHTHATEHAPKRPPRRKRKASALLARVAIACLLLAGLLLGLIYLIDSVSRPGNDANSREFQIIP